MNSDNLTLIDVDKIDDLPSEFPEEFKEFCRINDLKPPNIATGEWESTFSDDKL